MTKITEFIKNNKTDIIRPVFVLLSICVIIPLALALTNEGTKEKIEDLENNNEQQAMSRLIKADKFEKESYGEDEFDYYVAQTKSKTEGYIFVTSEGGYGGDISVMTAVNTDGTVKSVAILDASNETPGLGQNITKESFYSQFSGKKADISLVKGGAKEENNEVDAVTGATISSAAVTRAVNGALDNFDKISEAGKGVEKADEK